MRKTLLKFAVLWPFITVIIWGSSHFPKWATLALTEAAIWGLVMTAAVLTAQVFNK